MNICRVFFTLAVLLCLFINSDAQKNRNPCNNWKGNPPGKNVVFPNEMPGYKFFGEGRLKDLSFGLTTIDDVRKIFGQPLRSFVRSEVFEYDAEWLLIVGYLGDFVSENSVFLPNGTAVSKKYVFKPEYKGKINYIILRPRKKFAFEQKNYPDKSVKESRRKNDNFFTYTDKYGLTYKVFDRDAGNFESELDKTKFSIGRGDLLEISYFYPCGNDEKMFVEKN